MDKFQIPWNKGKKEAQPAKVKKSSGSPGKELGQDTWAFSRAWDPRDMQQSQVWIKIVQGVTKKHKEQE